VDEATVAIDEERVRAERDVLLAVDDLVLP